MAARAADEEPPRAASQLLTLDQVAERMAVSRNTVERLVESGELKAIDIHCSGRRPRLRVLETELAAFYKRRAIN